MSILYLFYAPTAPPGEISRVEKYCYTQSKMFSFVRNFGHLEVWCDDCWLMIIDYALLINNFRHLCRCMHFGGSGQALSELIGYRLPSTPGRLNSLAAQRQWKEHKLPSSKTPNRKNSFAKHVRTCFGGVFFCQHVSWHLSWTYCMYPMWWETGEGGWEGVGSSFQKCLWFDFAIIKHT